jgi:tripartite-type tricarboxylate transporter receptor subunit TctC
MRIVLAALALIVLLGAPPAARADDWPSRPIRLIVPFPPSGSNDIVGRMIAAQLSERLGKQVVVDNRPGAGSTIGAAMAASAPADGYTLLLISAAFVFNPSLYKSLPYDPANAFTPVAMLGAGPVALLVYPKLGVNTLSELIALAKAKPGQLNYATAGVGSLQHLASELFKMQAGIDIVHVPYKGGAPAMMDVASGQAQMTISTLLQSLPLVRDGLLKPLAVSGLKRSAVTPDLPTMDESGLPGYDATNWWGVLAPAGTPEEILARLDREIAGILASPETQKRFSAEGAEAVRISRQEFGRFVAAETNKWARVVKQAGIQTE